MSRSKSEIDLHFVWATYRRMRLIVPDWEQPLYACILAEAKRQGCEVLALGGMPDHIHLALAIPTKQSPATVMRCIKGVSSTFVRQRLAGGEFFGWQDGYGVFSFYRAHRASVIGYIHRQKQHHAEGTHRLTWEEVDEERPAEEPGKEPGV